MVWYDSSFGVHTHDDNKKKSEKKYKIGVFSKKNFE